MRERKQRVQTNIFCVNNSYQEGKKVSTNGRELLAELRLVAEHLRPYLETIKLLNTSDGKSLVIGLKKNMQANLLYQGNLNSLGE